MRERQGVATFPQIPAFIPRSDLMEQISRWAEIECATNGSRNFGLPMTVEAITKEHEGGEALWGVKVAIMRNGEEISEIAFRCGAAYGGRLRRGMWDGRSQLCVVDGRGWRRSVACADATLVGCGVMWCVAGSAL